MKAKDTLLLINTVTQNPILARRAWFWHVPSQMSFSYSLIFDQLNYVFYIHLRFQLEDHKSAVLSFFTYSSDVIFFANLMFLTL